MKKIFIILILTFLYIGYVAAETMNSHIDEGYKIIKEETITANDTLYFNKVFTLKKKNNIMICTIRYSSLGHPRETVCIEP